MKRLDVVKKAIVCLSLSVLSSAVQVDARELIDKIVVRVNGVNILKSDLDQKKISKNGGYFTLKEAINEELLYQKATERRLLPTELEVEKQIVSLKIYNNLSDLSEKEFEQQLREEGFTLREYKNQLAKMLAIEKLKHAEFSERVVVTSQEVEDYYKKHPVWEKEKYLLKITDLGKEDVDQDGKLIKKSGFKWDDLGWISKPDLSSHFSFVSKMKVGQVSKPFRFKGSYQLIKLVDKKAEHLKTLDESYINIERDLYAQKKKKFEKEFERELYEKASIVYLN